MNDLTLLRARLASAGPVEAAFACRALAQRGEVSLLSEYHRERSQTASAGDWQSAAWLWAAGEGLALLEPAARAAVLSAARRLLPCLAAGAYDRTVAYGALFGALRVMDSHLPDLQCARWLREVREAVFVRCTSGGRLSAEPGGAGIDPELLLLVPFGLFGPEDLLVVATVQALEEAGVPTGPPSAWLAWYYRVKGTHPHRLADLKAGLTGSTLWEAAFRVLLNGDGGGGITVVHIPTGHDHPYHRYTPEREPRDPIAGEVVELRATAQGEPDSVWLEWSLNGMAMAPVAAALNPAAGRLEAHWSVRLGPLQGGDRVRYRFTAPGAATAWFAFGVLRPVRAAALTRARQEGGALALTCAGEGGAGAASLRIEAGAEGALRLRFEPGAPPPPEPDPGAPPQHQAGPWSVGGYQIDPDPDPLRIIIRSQDGAPLLESHPSAPLTWLVDPDGEVRQVACAFRALPAERYYGTGERFDRLDRRGTVVINSVYNQYKGQGDRTYLPVPFVLCSRGLGLWADTAQVGEIDLAATEPDRLRFAFGGPALDLLLLPGPTMTDALRRFTALTGRPALPPAWAFGPWMSSNNWDTQAEVQRQADLTIQHDIPATVLVVEQWSDEATFYLFNDARYEPKPGSAALSYSDFTFPDWGRWQDPRAMVERLHKQGLKVLFWQIPVWKQMNGIRHEQRDRDEQFLLEQDYVVRNADGSPYRIPEGWFSGSLLIDFTNPAAVRWWLEQRRYLLDEVGLDGFKTDGGEFVWDREARFADGTGGSEGRNLYVNQFVGTTYRFVQERTGGRGITFSRAGYTGAQAFPLHWAGDEDSTWPAFRTSIIAGLNAGLAGISFWGWDLGGFSGEIPTAELFCRSAAMACFCPVMQYHAESKAQYNQDRTPWNIAERTGRPEALSAYRFFAHLRMNLLPYIYSEAVRSHQTGLPMMRPLALIHPDDPEAALIADQYYFGADLLVAPVVEEGAGGREVWLPAGTWYDFWSESRVDGPARVRVPAGWDRIPVFVRAGAVLPLNLAESGRPGEGMRNQDAMEVRNLHLVIYPAPDRTDAKHTLPSGEVVTVGVQAVADHLQVRVGGIERAVHVRVAGRPAHRIEAPASMNLAL